LPPKRLLLKRIKKMNNLTKILMMRISMMRILMKISKMMRKNRMKIKKL